VNAGTPPSGASLHRAAVRAGDLVVVRSREEILATLDEDGMLDRLPFMPEMLRYCGRTFRVAAVAHKTCDPAHKTGGRRLGNAVHLEDLRCDGSGHGGCQAACLIFWNTAWLAKVPAATDRRADLRPRLSERRLEQTTRAPGSTPERPLYSCQATRLYDATSPLKWWDPRQYVLDLYYRNVTPGRWLRLLVLSWFRALLRTGVAFRAVHAGYRGFHRLLLRRPAPEVGGGLVPAGTPTPVDSLGLEPGQKVRVKPHAEIVRTLSHDNKNRGMWFDDEATVFCNQEFEVERRVERIINEVTGEMMQMKTPCITLKGVYCRSMYSRDRLFCPRAITPYWREIWLQPVGPAANSAGGKQQ
jgi:hypothetical protein